MKASPLLFLITLMLNASWLLNAQESQDSSFLVKSIFTESPIISIDYSPDGRYLVSGGGDRTVDIWNVRSSRKVHSFEGHEDDILAVAFSPNGRLVASGGVDRKVIIWDIPTQSKVATLEGHNDYIRDLSFSPDGLVLASASWDRTAIVWDVVNGNRLQTLSGHRDNVTALAFSPDAKLLATGCGDHVIRVWDIKTGELKSKLEGHTDEIWDVDWSKQGQFIASGAWDNKARVWDIRLETEIMNYPGHVTDVWSVSFDPNGVILASAGGDKKVKLWDMATGEFLLDLSQKIHTSDIEEVTFSPDGSKLASASRDGTIRFWRIPTLAERISLLTQKRVDVWSQKTPYEKTSTYEKRMRRKEDFYMEEEENIQVKMVQYIKENINWDEGIELTGYNADGEYFLVKSPVLGDLKLNVPVGQAKMFEENFGRTEFRNLQLAYENGNLKVKSLTAMVKGLNRRYDVKPNFQGTNQVEIY